MNIFYLSSDPEEAARCHVDRHVVKMLTEYVQILCTVRRLQGLEAPYRLSHPHHPCVRWAAESLDHWLWLKQLAQALHAEYTFRYGKLHKAGLVIESLEAPPLPDAGFREPPQVMPEEYRQASAIEAYRTYYRLGKAHLASWKKRPPPDWYTEPPET